MVVFGGPIFQLPNFIVTVLAIIVTYLGGAKDQPNAVDLNGVSFKTTSGFNIGAIGVVLILIAIYATWW